jgi:hypothetical protein
LVERFFNLFYEVRVTYVYSSVFCYKLKQLCTEWPYISSMIFIKSINHINKVEHWFFVEVVHNLLLSNLYNVSYKVYTFHKMYELLVRLELSSIMLYHTTRSLFWKVLLKYSVPKYKASLINFRWSTAYIFDIIYSYKYMKWKNFVRGIQWYNLDLPISYNFT